jgi:uncharacterized protein
MEYVFALAIGITLGLMGSGGSILTVPVLVYIGGVLPATAINYSLFIVGITSLAGVVNYGLKKMVNFKAAITFALPSLVSVVLVRSWLLPLIPETILTTNAFTLSKSLALMLLFAVFMLVAARGMLKKSAQVTETNTSPSRTRLVITGFFTGMITGLLGAGGGFLIVPALVLVLKQDIKQAVGTSLLIISLNALTGFTADLPNTQPDWGFLIGFSGISIVGLLLGVYLSKFISGAKLKPLLGWFILAMGVFIIVKELIL